MSDYKFAGINIWTYSDNRAIVWLGGKGSHYGDTNKRNLRYERGRAGSLGLEVTVGGEDHEIKLRIGLAFTTFYIGITDMVKRNEEKLSAAVENTSKRYNRTIYSYELDYANSGRTTGFMAYVFDRDLVFRTSLWENDNRWTSNKLIDKLKFWPYCEGASWSWSFSDLAPVVFGKRIYKVVDGTEVSESVVVTLPEGDYQATVKTHLVETGYSRLVNYIWRSEIDVPDGLPKRGKGENSYDCGRNDTYGIMFGGTKKPHTFSEVAQMAADSCLKDRERYGWHEDDLKIKA